MSSSRSPDTNTASASTAKKRPAPSDDPQSTDTDPESTDSTPPAKRTRTSTYFCFESRTELDVNGRTVPVVDLVRNGRSTLTEAQKRSLGLAAAALYNQKQGEDTVLRGTVPLHRVQVALAGVDPSIDAIRYSASRQLYKCNTVEQREEVLVREQALRSEVRRIREDATLSDAQKEEGLDQLWNRMLEEEVEFFSLAQRRKRQGAIQALLRSTSRHVSIMATSLLETLIRGRPIPPGSTGPPITEAEVADAIVEATDFVNAKVIDFNQLNWHLPTPEPSGSERSESIGLNISENPDGPGFIYNGDTASETGSENGQAQAPAAQPPLVLVGRVATDPNHAEYDANIVAALPAKFVQKTRPTAFTRGNVQRPDGYWRVPETHGDEEPLHHFTNSQIRFDRHADYSRGISKNRCGSRKGDMPEFHSILSAKERLGISKMVNGIDVWGPIHAYFKQEILEACLAVEFTSDFKKSNKPGFDLLVRRLLRLSTILPPGVKQALMFGMREFDDQGEDFVDTQESIKQEDWHQDRRYYFHTWEHYCNDACKSVMRSWKAGQQLLEKRDTAAAGQEFSFGHTPVLNAWYKSQHNTLPFPVREFAIPGAPDIDATTGYPYGALDANGRPYPKLKLTATERAAAAAAAAAPPTGA